LLLVVMCAVHITACRSCLLACVHTGCLRQTTWLVSIHGFSFVSLTD